MKFNLFKMVGGYFSNDLSIDLGNIIEFVDQLNDVDTSKIAPLANPLEKTAKTRKDIVTAKNLKKKLLEIAPSANEDYFLVPRVVE